MNGTSDTHIRTIAALGHGALYSLGPRHRNCDSREVDDLRAPISFRTSGRLMPDASVSTNGPNWQYASLRELPQCIKADYLHLPRSLSALFSVQGVTQIDRCRKHRTCRTAASGHKYTDPSPDASSCPLQLTGVGGSPRRVPSHEHALCIYLSSGNIINRTCVASTWTDAIVGTIYTDRLCASFSGRQGSASSGRTLAVTGGSEPPRTGDRGF